MATLIHRARSADRAQHERLEQLLSQQGSVLREGKQALRGSLPSGVTDLAERSMAGEERGVGFSLLQITSQAVQGIEGALQRLEAGDFGSCSDCGCNIGAARLRALPFATLCLACREKQDLTAVRAANRESRDHSGDYYSLR